MNEPNEPQLCPASGGEMTVAADGLTYCPRTHRRAQPEQQEGADK